MLDFVNKYLLGGTVPILLICVGIYFTLYLRGFHIFKTAKIFKIFIKKKMYGMEQLHHHMLVVQVHQVIRILLKQQNNLLT